MTAMRIRPEGTGTVNQIERCLLTSPAGRPASARMGQKASPKETD